MVTFSYNNLMPTSVQLCSFGHLDTLTKNDLAIRHWTTNTQFSTNHRMRIVTIFHWLKHISLPTKDSTHVRRSDRFWISVTFERELDLCMCLGTGCPERELLRLSLSLTPLLISPWHQIPNRRKILVWVHNVCQDTQISKQRWDITDYNVWCTHDLMVEPI